MDKARIIRSNMKHSMRIYLKCQIPCNETIGHNWYRCTLKCAMTTVGCVMPSNPSLIGTFSQECDKTFVLWYFHFLSIQKNPKNSMMINVYNEEGLLLGDIKGCTHAYSLKSIRDNIDIYVDNKGNLAKHTPTRFSWWHH